MNLLWRRAAVVTYILLALPALTASALRLLAQADDPLGWAWLGLSLVLLNMVLISGGAARTGQAVVGVLVAGALVTSIWTAQPLLWGATAALLWAALLAATLADFVTRRRAQRASLHDFYMAAVKARRVRSDPQQLAIVERLDTLAAEFARYEARRHLPWSGFLAPPRGIYLHGPAGRGKSFLLDGMYDISPSAVKARFHFHELMSALNARVNATPTVSMRRAVRDLTPRASLIVIDEVNVLDVASAILFSRLLHTWWARGCVVCLSSNLSPAELFAGLPTNHQEVARLEQTLSDRLQVMELCGAEDYRLQKLTGADLFQHPITPDTTARINEIVALLAESEVVTEPALLSGRCLPCQKRASGVIWHDFRQLCAARYSYEDYLRLVAEYPNIIVTDVPRIADEDQARRFAWLVEIVYDAKKRLILTAQVPREALFADNLSNKGLDIDYVKITSRLAEMQSSEYDYALA